jgi:hypothetical protein
MLSQQVFPLLTIIWINGVVVRMTLRDSVDLFAPLYYATPWPVLAVLTLVFLRYFWRQPVAVFAIIFVAHMLFGAWIMENWRTVPLSKDPADLRVLQWNVAHPVRWRPEIIAQVRQDDADVIAISEPVPASREGTSRTAAAGEDWRRAFPDYSCELHGEEMLCMVRGEVLNRRPGRPGPGLTLRTVQGPHQRARNSYPAGRHRRTPYSSAQKAVDCSGRVGWHAKRSTTDPHWGL